MSAVSLKGEPPTQTPRAALTTKAILRLYVPLALSWVFMALEGPSTTAIVGRLPHKELNSAALLVLLSVSLWIESPVIDLLSTATTLAKNRQHYLKLTNYVRALILWVTFAHATIVLSPIYNFVTLRVLSLPHDVAYQARLGLIIMIPWSGFIGWRRYHQGILIRYHSTRLISAGTFMRIITMTLVGWSLYWFSQWPGVVIAGTALVSAVAAECAFVHFASRRIVRREFDQAEPVDLDVEEMGFAPSEDAEAGTQPSLLGGDEPKDVGNLTYKKLLAFHLPLTATTMVALTGVPVISAALSKSALPVLSLASWQVVNTLIWLCRTIEFALPEVIITLYKDAQSAAKLRMFSIKVGLIIAGLMTLMVVTGGDRFYFGRVLGESKATVDMAHLAFICAISLPLIGSQQNYIKGMLTAHHLTTARLMSSLVSFSTLLLMLTIGVFLKWTGVMNAAAALNVSLLGEVGVLFWFWRKGVRELKIAL